VSNIDYRKMETYNYYSDPRVIASMQTSAYKIVEDGRTTTVIQLNEYLLLDMQMTGVVPEGHDGRLSFPTNYDVCPLCNGTGKVVNPSIDCGGLTAEDFAEDPEFAEAYWRGDYDKTCPTCGGKRVTIGMANFKITHPKVAKLIEEWEKEEAISAAESAAELRMGA